MVLDANVLVRAQLRDLFLRLAEAELIEFWWSDPILAEMRGALVKRLGRSAPSIDRLCDAIRNAFTTGEVANVDTEQFSTPDPDDAHVLAAAVTAEADLLVTFDRKGFPGDDTLERWDLAVTSPDEAIQELVACFGAAVVAEAFRDMTALLANPPLDLTNQLERLEEVAPVSAVVLGAALDIKRYDDLYNDMVLASAPDNPRAAVTELIDRVAADDAEGVDRLLTAQLRRRLGWTRRARLRRWTAVLAEVIAHRDQWGFGTAHRMETLDTEIVVLAQSEARIYQQATAVRAHRFRPVRHDGHWFVDDVNMPDPEIAAAPDPPA